MSSTFQFRSVRTPSGKPAYEAWCAVLRGDNGEEAAVCAPTIERLKQIWAGISKLPLDAARAQHVWLVAFDGAAPKDAPKSPDPRGASIACSAAGCKRDAAFIVHGMAVCYEHR